MAPWRILEQTVVMRMPDGEPGPALQFTIDPANSAQCRLRIVSPEQDADAYEVVFTTGGLVHEQVYQPRILKPFARGPIVVPPEPVKVAVKAQEPEGDTVLVNPLTNLPETDGEREKREALQELKDRRAGIEAEQVAARAAQAENLRTTEVRTGLAPGVNTSQTFGSGPDSTDPNSPGAQARRAAEAGVESTAPEKGMASTGIPTSPGPLAGQPLASNSVDQQRQEKAGSAKTLEQLQAEDAVRESERIAGLQQGQRVDTPMLKRNTEPAG